jgi:hypothetical protein
MTFVTYVHFDERRSFSFRSSQKVSLDEVVRWILALQVTKK